MKRKVALSVPAILAVLCVWLGMRVMSPALAYYPPDILEQALPPSVFVRNDIETIVFISYLTVALVLLFLAFATIQHRLIGRRGIKGLVFGTVLGVLWALAFLSALEFFGTTLKAELINGVVDIIPLALGGWFAGLILGTDTEGDGAPASSHLMAIPVIGIVFVVIHSATLLLVDDPAGIPARLMFTPHTAAGYLAVAALGGWVGVMYVVLRSGMPSSSIWAQSGVFAVVVFGHSWLWFNSFFNILYSEVLVHLLTMSLIDILAVFVGVFLYEQLVRHRFAGPESMTDN